MPDKPNKLSFEATNSNVSKMCDWFLQRYSVSTFNLCPHKWVDLHLKYIWRMMLNRVLVIHQHPCRFIGRNRLKQISIEMRSWVYWNVSYFIISFQLLASFQSFLQRCNFNIKLTLGVKISSDNEKMSC